MWFIEEKVLKPTIYKEKKSLTEKKTSLVGKHINHIHKQAQI